MSDNNDRRARGEDDRTNDPTVDFGDEFGVVRFSDEDDSGPALSFSGGDTEQLPHWTEPPTGEIPRFLKDPTGGQARPVDETRAADSTSVWSAYRDDSPTGGTRRPPVDLTGGASRKFETSPPPPVERPRREGRIVIGTDPTGETRRPAPRDQSTAQRRRPTQVTRAPRPESRTGSAPRPVPARDLPTATAVGALMAAAFIAATVWRPAAVMVIVVAAVGLAAFEFLTQSESAGYRPATVIGVVGSVAAPLAAYWIGDAALPLVFAFAFIATAITFVAADGVESAPVPNTAITMVPLIWVGLLGSYAALILRFSTYGGSYENTGTDTFFILVVGVIAHDIVAFFAGRAAGRTPLRQWISPNKTVEGLVGGVVGTFVAVIVVGMQSTTWNDPSEWILLAIVISIFAPLGDLAESMFKRNLNIKDFGSVIKGHGGALDRFDSLLFAMPAVYYLTLVIQPWA